MSDGLFLAALTLTAYRATRLLAVDVVFDRQRQWLARRAGRVEQKLSYLVSCPFCLGVWASCLLVAVAWAFRPLPEPAVWFGAVTGGQALLSALDARLVRDD